MVKQYPYSLWIQTLSQESVQNELGEFVGAETVWSMVSVCRDEANGGGQTVQLADSTAFVYSSLVQLPKSCPRQAEGTLIRVMDGDTIRLTGTVLRFQSDQLHARLWV